MCGWEEFLEAGEFVSNDAMTSGWSPGARMNEEKGCPEKYSGCILQQDGVITCETL